MMNLNLKKILIIDDDLIVLETIAALLENELVDIEIIKISNPKIALEFIQKNGKEIQVIISDVRMPDYNGAYLAKAALEINSQMRFFLMTGHLNLLEQLDLLFIGIEKVFLKPFDVSEIIVELNKEPTEISFINSKMVPLKISQLKQKKTYPFDIYISLSDNKSIKIFPANEEVDEKRLDQLASKNLTVLFANKEDALLNGLKLFVPIRSSNLKLSTELNFKLYYQKKGQFKLLLNENTFFDQNALNVINSNNIKCLYIEDVYEESFRQYLDKYLKEFMTSKTIKSNEKIETLNDVIGNKLNNIANNPNIENINSLKESINSLQNFLENDKGASRYSCTFYNRCIIVIFYIA
jgi:DNA-binding NarL/FixJ family response regulator